jgi:small subunit ribosomal protein S20
MINRRYSSTIKTLSKLFSVKIKSLASADTATSSVLKTETQTLVKNLYSIIDKAVKKNVIHKNTAARKKSKIGLISNKM